MTLMLDPDRPVVRGNPTRKVPFDFKIAMTKRGDNNLYVQEGYVLNSDGEYQGRVECDGGGFTADPERTTGTTRVSRDLGHRRESQKWMDK
jgi:hypothetical protein